VEVDFPGKGVVVLALRSNVFKPPEGAARRRSRASRHGRTARTSSRSFIEVSSADDVDMATAEFILAIGRGIGGRRM